MYLLLTLLIWANLSYVITKQFLQGNTCYYIDEETLLKSLWRTAIKEVNDLTLNQHTLSAHIFDKMKEFLWVLYGQKKLFSDKLHQKSMRHVEKENPIFRIGNPYSLRRECCGEKLLERFSFKIYMSIELLMDSTILHLDRKYTSIH